MFRLNCHSGVAVSAILALFMTSPLNNPAHGQVTYRNDFVTISGEAPVPRLNGMDLGVVFDRESWQKGFISVFK